MRAETAALLHNLCQIAWFARVGVREPARVVVLSSWEEAVISCRSLHWRETEWEADALLGFRLQKIEESAYHDQWNKHVDEINPHVQKLLDEKVAKITRQLQLPKAFTNTVERGLRGACLELEYADLCAPFFFSNVAQWYTRGHFPCGWLGDFPEGELIIF